MNGHEEVEQSKKDQPQSDRVQETPALWIEGHLRIFDPETKQQMVNTRA
jgi:hypothetical protein